MKKPRKPPKNGCPCKVKGGGRCGKVLVEGARCCIEHFPKTAKLSRQKSSSITTYSVKTTFDGETKVSSKEYESYIQSEEWRKKAEKEKKLNPNCSICNRRGILHVHHRTYVRCGKERDGDLIVLCSDCHKLFHDHYKYDGRVGYFVPK